MENKRAWIVSDGEKEEDYIRNISFLYSPPAKNLWGKDRSRTHLFYDLKEAEKYAEKYDSNVWEIRFSDETSYCQPFVVIDWAS
jgi:hypothetical protein